ncbi:sensor histidine kinase [Streptomyces sp. NPDC020141]|uniref:sensor histidine kinase n=1 Tax=Streptomyces sp. NPDC020141 TaxID=3365065 RepID=UPI003792EC7B
MKGWSGRSGLAKVDLYSRGTVYLILWVGVLTLIALLLSHTVRRSGPPLVLLIAGLALALTTGVLCSKLARRAMDAYLGQGRVPGRLLARTTLVVAATTGVGGALAAIAGEPDLLATVLVMAVLPLSSVHALMVPNRVTVLVQTAGVAVLFAVLLPAGMPVWAALLTALFTGLITAWMAFTARVSMWMLAVMWELREARDVQARLAVAEERLRFGRDLHDVMGRNLAVVALKSELAVQLARRGRPEAVDQMLEVQRIARETQREVRDVVRGYREADLRVELEGARAVLEAAGIACTVVVGEPALPEEVRSALGWVVREATTNVLRHGDARRCTVSLGEVDGGVRLVVENDGTESAPGGAARAAAGGGPSGAPGSGLAGLRERLSAVGGVLEAGPGRAGRFRLTATVPLPERNPARAADPA